MYYKRVKTQGMTHANL